MNHQKQVKCVTCRQPVPESVERLNYFAQLAFKPEADEVENFLQEFRDITEHIESFFFLLINVDKGMLDDDRLYKCLYLGEALATAASHRGALAEQALGLRKERHAEEAAARH